MKTLLVSFRMLFVLSLFCGVLYPLLVMGIGNIFFSKEIAGSLIEKNGQVIGSSLIAQEFKSDKYFKSRPSAANYATLPSGASNLAASSLAFKETVEKRKSEWGAKVPDEMLTNSGSGLDPHISPQAVNYQFEKVAYARNLNEEQRKNLKALIFSKIENPQFGFLGTRKVNVLILNQAMDELFLR